STRAEWKLGKVEEVYKNRGGKTKAVGVKMPNGHVLKRPVSVLYTLEVSEEERETLPTAESKGFVKHPADQNLQAEEAEEEEEPSLKPPGQGTCTRYQFVLVMLFATFALASSARRTYSFTYAQNIATACT
uniref:DUF5641 domain-containing protein n=1 Tax=Parascaris univalens TaxID=6257 RepID=A0A915ASY7_PARUN